MKIANLTRFLRRFSSFLNLRSFEVNIRNPFVVARTGGFLIILLTLDFRNGVNLPHFLLPTSFFQLPSSNFFYFTKTIPPSDWIVTFTSPFLLIFRFLAKLDLSFPSP